MSAGIRYQAWLWPPAAALSAGEHDLKPISGCLLRACSKVLSWSSLSSLQMLLEGYRRGCAGLAVR